MLINDNIKGDDDDKRWWWLDNHTQYGSLITMVTNKSESNSSLIEKG